MKFGGFHLCAHIFFGRQQLCPIAFISSLCHWESLCVITVLRCKWFWCTTLINKLLITTTGSIHFCRPSFGIIESKIRETQFTGFFVVCAWDDRHLLKERSLSIFIIIRSWDLFFSTYIRNITDTAAHKMSRRLFIAVWSKLTLIWPKDAVLR